MNISLNLLIVFAQITILTFFLCSCGFVFRKIITNKNHRFNYEEDGLFGFILIGFLSLIINFFTPLTQLLNSIIFFILILISFNYGFFNQINKKIFIKILITAFIGLILLIYSNVNRPDAWLYHLPYSKIVNEHKIIIGVSNLHSRFAHISIFQYISSFFNNYIFFKNGLVIPITLVASFFFSFAYTEFTKNFKKNNLKIYSFLVFLFLVVSLYSFNRYSEYGNDAQVHIYYLFFTILVLKIFVLKKKYEINVIELFFLSLFLFLIKPTFIFATLIPIFLLLENRNIIRKYKSLSLILYFVFLFSWLIKNLLTSGCVVYPLNFTCNKNLPWSTEDISINSLENEAWSKGWPDFKSELNITQSEYIQNFLWLETWLDNHFQYIFKKILPVIIFIALNFLILYFSKCLKKNTYEKGYIYLFLFNLLFALVWLLKFPVYRLGLSLIYINLILLSYIIFTYRIIPNKINFLERYCKYFLVLVIFIVLIKNFIRIYENSNSSITPNIYFTSKENLELFEVYNKDNIFTHYHPGLNKLCGYINSPCTHISKKLSVEEYFGYKIYSIER